MKSTVSRLFHFVASLAFVALLAAPAYAKDKDKDKDKDNRDAPASQSAPEIDPAGLGAIGSLLIGGSLLLKSRRNARITN